MAYYIFFPHNKNNAPHFQNQWYINSYNAPLILKEQTDQLRLHACSPKTVVLTKSISKNE